ncbi:MAG: FAD/NAD(P)-binding protein [Pseudomonadota bacterium]
MSEISTDYLVVGAGATAMAFVDTLLDHTDATITLVDKRDVPGGHWNDAYPFVRLHQPSSFYGVASKELSSFNVDKSGFNRGLEELASGQSIVAYFHDVMERKFLPSGRIRFLPMCEYADGRLNSSFSGKQIDVRIKRKLVDASYTENSIPLTHSRKFHVASGVACIPPNDLPRNARAYSHFTVLGAGKTAIDALLWLLSRGAAQEQIRWIVPRDPWLTNRINFQPGGAFFFDGLGGYAAQLQALSTAATVDEVAHMIEEAGIWMRLSAEVRPQMMHGATVSRLEMEALRGVTDVVRLGRVKNIDAARIHLDQGDLTASPGSLYVDCTASAFPTGKWKPIFEDYRITPQMIRMYQPTFSAAVLARIEALGYETDENNALAAPVPMTDTVADWVEGQCITLCNAAKWTEIEPLAEWIKSCRLDGYRRTILEADMSDPKVRDLLGNINTLMPKAVENAKRLVN